MSEYTRFDDDPELQDVREWYIAGRRGHNPFGSDADLVERFDRWLAQHDAELRAEVEQLREGIEALLPGETVNVHAGGGNLVSQRRVVNPDRLRALLAGSGEQPSDAREKGGV